MLSTRTLRRTIRYNGLVERAQQLVRKGRALDLIEIGLTLDVSPGDVIIDCGANVGDISSRFARTGARVYAFEPNPICYEVLKRRFWATPNVKVMNNGVMDRECTLTLKTPKAHDRFDAIEATVAASFTAVPAVDADVIEVKCIRLSDFIRSVGKVRLLKLDIEGSEIEVLNDLLDTDTARLVDLTVVETHEKQQPELLAATNALRSRLEQAGLASKVRLDWV